MRAFVRRLSNYVLMSADMIRFILSQFAIGGGGDMTWDCYAVKVLHHRIAKSKKGHSSHNTILPLFLSVGNRAENKLTKLQAVMTQSSMLSTWSCVFYVYQFLYFEVKGGGRDSPALS